MTKVIQIELFEYVSRISIDKEVLEQKIIISGEDEISLRPNWVCESKTPKLVATYIECHCINLTIDAMTHFLQNF